MEELVSGNIKTGLNNHNKNLTGKKPENLNLVWVLTKLFSKILSKPSGSERLKL